MTFVVTTFRVRVLGTDTAERMLSALLVQHVRKAQGNNAFVMGMLSLSLVEVVSIKAVFLTMVNKYPVER